MQSLWEDKLNGDTYKYYAISNYADSGNATWASFFDTLKEIQALCKTMYKSRRSFDTVNETIRRLLLVSDMFVGNSIARLLFYFASKDAHCVIRTYLTYLHRLPDYVPETNGTIIDEKLYEHLLSL